jgi:prophage protein DUF1660
MGFNLLCVLMGHKWMPAEASSEPGVRMVCQRCGQPQRSGPSDEPPGHPEDKRKDLDAGGTGIW